jgi:hypothetical protein
MSAPTQPEAHGVHIDAQPGSVVISIDGTPLPADQVTGYTLHHDVQASLPTLILQTRQPAGAEFEGLARVAVGVSRSPGEVVAAFLAEVDPVLLDQEALNRSDYGGGPGATARAMLATLTEWALGGKAGT